MKLTNAALAIALALGTFSAAAPLAAQAPAAKERQFKISSGARAPIVALQTAVNARDAATIAAKLAAAKAAAKSADDKYVIGQLQLKAAADAKDQAGIAAAIEAIISSGGAQKGELSPLYVNLGKTYYNTKQYDRAATTFERLLVTDPNSSDALVMLAETRRAQGRTADAVALLQKGIASRTAIGQKAPEEWFKRAVALAYDAKLPVAVTVSRQWIAAYPTPGNWRDALRIRQALSNSPDNNLDLMRLARAAKALAGESDYYRYASTAAAKGLPGEAKAVLDEGFALKAIDRSKPIFRDVYASASGKVVADRASLAGLERAALAAPTAKQAMVTADAYLGYGEYAKAAALYRAALGKSGPDRDLANLRLGIALARSGDSAAAIAAFTAVGGAQAEAAKYWLLFLGRPA